MASIAGVISCAWQTVYGYFRRWQKDDTWLMVHDKLYQWVRVAADRQPSP